MLERVPNLGRRAAGVSENEELTLNRLISMNLQAESLSVIRSAEPDWI